MDGEDGVERLRLARDDGAIDVVSLEETPLIVEFRGSLDVEGATARAYALEDDAELGSFDLRSRLHRFK